MLQKITVETAQNIKAKIISVTQNFIFVFLFINIFQLIFGAQSTIVGVSLAIMMTASMQRDLTAAPLKHLIKQAATLVTMAIAACLVVTLPPIAALPINFVVVFIIIYSYTYEYASHLYFPYILSYLFIIFISPITLSQLPLRVLEMLIGAVCIIGYQLFMGRKRVAETAQSVLTSIIDIAIDSVTFLLTGNGKMADLNLTRKNLCKLSRTIYDRRKKVLCISDASFSMLDAGRGLEHIIILLHNFNSPITSEWTDYLKNLMEHLKEYRDFVAQKVDTITQIDDINNLPESMREEAEDFINALIYIRNHLLHMSDPEERNEYHKTALSLKMRIESALDVSHVRVIYALRVAILISVFTTIVQMLNLPHGKWLLLTLASLSLPYSDDVGSKTKKRIFATVIGGIISVVAYALVPSMTGRSIIMILAGYVGSYFSGYAGTFTFSTVGALGGAVLMTAFNLKDLGAIAALRLAYICIGALIAIIANCAIFPYNRKTATLHLIRKYMATTELLARICQKKEVDTQLYYNLVIQAHLQEDKLVQNASDDGWDKISSVLEQCRAKTRAAHRLNSIERRPVEAL